jgi:hypothetical protein
VVGYIVAKMGLSYELNISFERGFILTTERSEFEPWNYQEFSLLHIVQKGSGAHIFSYPKNIGGFFPEGKASGE